MSNKISNGIAALGICVAMISAGVAVGQAEKVEDLRSVAAEARMLAATANDQTRECLHSKEVLNVQGLACPYGVVFTYNGGEPLCLSQYARHILAEECYRGEVWACGETVDEHETHKPGATCYLPTDPNDYTPPEAQAGLRVEEP